MKTRSGFAENFSKLCEKKAFVLLILALSAVVTALTLIFEIMSVVVFVSIVPLVLVLIKKSEDGEINKKKIFFLKKFCELILKVFFTRDKIQIETKGRTTLGDRPVEPMQRKG